MTGLGLHCERRDWSFPEFKLILVIFGWQCSGRHGLLSCCLTSTEARWPIRDGKGTGTRE